MLSRCISQDDLTWTLLLLVVQWQEEWFNNQAAPNPNPDPFPY